ncbi:MAG: Hint domain-containing protein [Rhodopila sp.]|nr:Hint domain-containing protein [Rhodopila sp.]
MANTFTFSYGGTDYSWDTSTNWTPTSPAVDYYGNGTTNANSFVMDSTGNGGDPYTATFGDDAGADGFYDLTIAYTGATLTQNMGPGTGLNYDDAITISAGTLDLGDYGGINWTGVGTTGGAIVLGADGVIQGEGYIGQTIAGITGTGTIKAIYEGDAFPLNIQTAIHSGIHVEITAGATLEIGAAIDAGVTITLDDPDSSTLLLDDTADFQGTIVGLATSDSNSFVDLTYLDPTTVDHTSVNDGVVTLYDSSGNTLASLSIAGGYTSAGFKPDDNGGTDVFIVCFGSGTQILTPDGNVPVEAITAGDQVIAVVDGQRVAQPVKWVGYRKLDLNRQANGAALAPIRIKRGAMAEGLPARDLLVSPCHCMLIDGKLVPAKLLVNDMTIVRETAMTTVEYYHIELDRHAVIIAEGVETESYLDTGNRAFFSNAGLALILHPEFHVNAGLRCWETDACAPLAISPAAVLPVWRPITDRAVALGYVPPTHATTTEADIHLVADGRRIDTIEVKGNVHSFMVPAGVKSLALASRSVVPGDLKPYLDDPRQIGVAVRGITIRGQAGRAEFAADHPALAHGWHAPERADRALWRWTKGHAALPIGAVEGPVIVDVMISETTTYLIDEVRAEGRLAA